MVKINMNMPKRCDECIFNQVAFDSELFREGEVYCCVNIKSVDKNMEDGTKPDWCPLIECQ